MTREPHSNRLELKKKSCTGPLFLARHYYESVVFIPNQSKSQIVLIKSFWFFFVTLINLQKDEHSPQQIFLFTSLYGENRNALYSKRSLNWCWNNHVMIVRYWAARCLMWYFMSCLVHNSLGVFTDFSGHGTTTKFPFKSRYRVEQLRTLSADWLKYFRQCWSLHFWMSGENVLFKWMNILFVWDPLNIAVGFVIIIH